LTHLIIYEGTVDDSPIPYSLQSPLQYLSISNTTFPNSFFDALRTTDPYLLRHFTTLDGPSVANLVRMGGAVRAVQRLSLSIDIGLVGPQPWQALRELIEMRVCMSVHQGNPIGPFCDTLYTIIANTTSLLSLTIRSQALDEFESIDWVNSATAQALRSTLARFEYCSLDSLTIVDEKMSWTTARRLDTAFARYVSSRGWNVTVAFASNVELLDPFSYDAQI